VVTVSKREIIKEVCHVLENAVEAEEVFITTFS
jgi:hypothetical protein